MKAPSDVTGLFWNTNPDRLEVKRDADFIIETVLPRGNLEALKWLFSTYGQARIKDFVRRDAISLRRLPTSELVFWSKVLALPVPPRPTGVNRWRPTRTVADDRGLAGM